MSSLATLREAYQQTAKHLQTIKDQIIKDCEAKFGTRDKDKSNTISVGEFLEYFFDKTDGMDYFTVRKLLDERMERFKEIDKDHNGSLTLDEVIAFQLGMLDPKQ